jgi:mannose/cellobiose epimerase-like protein (N-acyl-D-glucosamine 2-epimerase family)
MSVEARPELALSRLRRFVEEQALPLWASAGFDDAAQCFHERLSFSSVPLRVPRRLMVQARQIATFSRACILKWSDHGAIVSKAFQNVLQRYRSPDGDAGWIFSVGPDGRRDMTRDLYTHAFVLYMLAWLFRLEQDTSLLALADTTLGEVDQIFGCGDRLGFLSKVPGPIDLREQNPHMHLFEALLALADASGMERYLARANALVGLFDLVLADPITGTVRETFDGNWKVQHANGENVVEPGHQMEWAWLLREWQRLTGSPVDSRVDCLIAHAITYGVDRERGLVRAQVQENGKMISGASRVWPQTEAIRALCREYLASGLGAGLVSEITDGLFTNHLPAHLQGGWIDQVDANGSGTVDHMPASTLYHLAGAAMDASNLLRI